MRLESTIGIPCSTDTSARNTEVSTVMTATLPSSPERADNKRNSTVMRDVVDDELATVAHVDYQEVDWSASEERKLVRK